MSHQTGNINIEWNYFLWKPNRNSEAKNVIIGILYSLGGSRVIRASKKK